MRVHPIRQQCINYNNLDLAALTMMKGKTYGGWIIEELINDSSGNGVVWRVSKESGERGAIKILKDFDSTTKSEKRRKRFISEIKKLESIMVLGISGVMPILDHNADEVPPGATRI